MTEAMAVCAGIISLAALQAIRARLGLGRTSRHHSRLDYHL